jgi:glycosyltransferase involved in cell wall biosynthesis
LNNKSVNPLNELITIYRYYKIYKQIKPALILHYTPKPNIYGSIAALILKIPCINNIAGLGTAFTGAGLLSVVVKRMYKFSQKAVEKVFFQNKDDLKMFTEKKIVPAQKAVLLPGSGIELDKYPVRIKQEESTFRFLLIARFIWEKGIKEYVKAAESVKRSYPHVECVLLGYVDYNNPRGIPERYIHKWHNSGTVRWVGKQDDVRPYIADADCVVLPSYYREGTPRSLLEAASMGKPIIAADSIGTKEPVENGKNGLLCRPRDPYDLADKMQYMVEMETTKRIEMGMYGRLKMEREYDIRFVIDQYMESIDFIISRK